MTKPEEDPSAKRTKGAVPIITSSGPWRAELGPPAKSMPVTSPVDGETIAMVELGGKLEVDAAVKAAEAAHSDWANLTSKRRAAIMNKFHHLVEQSQEELIRLIMAENGKNRIEAAGDLAKGLETVEWACTIPNGPGTGRTLAVSSGVVCQELRDPVGVVASIVPFNFPFMVPMWTTPIALVAGNCVILKASEKVPMTMSRTAELLAEAGVPPGVFQIVQGGVEAVNALCDSPGIAALTFVGSSKIAKIVYDRARAAGKKALALGGAKNHLVAAPDLDIEMAASDIVASFAGCAGQRCMAAATLLTIGEQPQLLAKVVQKASGLRAGQEKGCMGPVIDGVSEARIRALIESAERDGATVLLDGRGWGAGKGGESGAAGHWVGPTVLSLPAHMREHEILATEVFGPVLCVYQVATATEALQFENADPHGNAACIYTQSGATADYFARRFAAAMIGVNIGVPVPREPFSFGGLEGSRSKYGEHDITGEGGLNFFTSLRKITTKWTTDPNAPPDAANFGGVM